MHFGRLVMHDRKLASTHHRNMTEVVVIHHLHDLQHTVVWGHGHQFLCRCHDLMHWYTGRALALYHNFGQVICNQTP